MRQHLAMHCRAGWSPLKKGMTCKAWMAITAGWKRSMAAWWWRWWRWILCFMFQRIEGKTMENLQKSTGCYSKFSHHPMRGMLALGLWIWDSGSNIIIWDDQNWKKTADDVWCFHHRECKVTTCWRRSELLHDHHEMLVLLVVSATFIHVYHVPMSCQCLWIIHVRMIAHLDIGKHHLGWPPGQTSGL